MSRYEEENYGQSNMRQKDLVLSVNEFVFIQSKTNGQIKTYAGPIMVPLSAQESLVVFNQKTKRFEETTDFEKARQLFVSAPEGWYVVLKNPTKDSTHPEPAKAMNSPELNIGKKINIAGPCSFSLFPGQMAKVIQGHRLRSNQYLIARVYDAEAASSSTATIVDASGKKVLSEKTKYFVGQLLVIKGTEISFYMPPTGIEVLAENGEYVRDAVTLERLEYVILKDESGSKRYVSGPSVVFPDPTETFVESNSKKNSVIFRALELSPISGIYVKVIADYKEKDKEYKTGEELFITGNDQMIYYPRPEHALIQYDGKYMHHAIAIPEGEGRYILNRLTGEIKTVKGPAMFLPDPRKEVVVKRKLSSKECALYYPGNKEVFNYNSELSEKSMEKMARLGKATAATDAINTAYCTADSLDSLAIFEATANISRGVSYTKPRTITLDTKYEGVVSIEVWNGYAVCVVSKTGDKRVVVGPATVLLDYDETLQPILVDGEQTVFLKVDKNKVNLNVAAATLDHVLVKVNLDYYVRFAGSEDKWFDVEDYTTSISSELANSIRTAIGQYNIQDFYDNYAEIVKKAVYETGDVRHFNDNDAEIYNVDVLNLEVSASISNLLTQHQSEIIAKKLELKDAEAQLSVIKAIDEAERERIKLNAETEKYRSDLKHEQELEDIKKKEILNQKNLAVTNEENKAKVDMQAFLDTLNNSTIARQKAKQAADIEYRRELNELEEAKQEAYANTVAYIMESIQPGLIEALSSKANAALLAEATKNMSAYSIANGESVATTVDKLLRGTTLEGVLTKIANQSKDN